MIFPSYSHHIPIIFPLFSPHIPIVSPKKNRKPVAGPGVGGAAEVAGGRAQASPYGLWTKISNGYPKDGDILLGYVGV